MVRPGVRRLGRFRARWILVRHENASKKAPAKLAGAGPLKRRPWVSYTPRRGDTASRTRPNSARERTCKPVLRHRPVRADSRPRVGAAAEPGETQARRPE